MNDHPLQWVAPQPFWLSNDGSVAARAHWSRPQILRFATDQFMEELLATLEHDPASLARYAVREETWRGPASAPATEPARWLDRKPSIVLALQRKARAKLGGASSGAGGGGSQSVPLKLYQPAHMRHYLIGGSLVCQSAGLPDRSVDPAREKVSFVVRRLFPKTPLAPDAPLPEITDAAAWIEYAFVLKGGAGEWTKVAAFDTPDAATLAAGEERVSMFPAFFTQDDGHRRRLFIGSVPAGRRETYQGAKASTPVSTSTDTPMDPRVVLFHTQVLGPWKALVNRAMTTGVSDPSVDADNVDKITEARPDWVFDKDGNDKPDRNKPDDGALRAARSMLQTASWYLLLDLDLYLQKHLPDFRERLRSGAAMSGNAEQALVDALGQSVMVSKPTSDGYTLASTNTGGNLSLAEQSPPYGGDIETNLVDALRRIASDDAAAAAATSAPRFEQILEGASGEFALPGSGAKAAGWPGFLFLFADPWYGVLRPPAPASSTLQPSPNDYLSEKIQARIDALADLVGAALPAANPAVENAQPTLATMQPADMRDAWYVLRLAYERPECKPFHGAVVSAPTRPFQLAGFFDPDAPARPIRIGLPVDVSPAGLRKFDKNTVFVLSDMLCGQIDRMKGIGLADLVLSVLPWPFHKDLSVPSKGSCKTGDGVSLGVMCSLSIPIITICALLLLMIIVSLLDLIFRWIPYFVVCFPLPGFKAKR